MRGAELIAITEHIPQWPAGCRRDRYQTPGDGPDNEHSRAIGESDGELGLIGSRSKEMTSEEVAAVFDAEGLTPYSWSNRAGDKYDWHHHDYHKVLVCVSGSITFHLRGEDRELRAGERLDLPPRTEHAATVGSHGVTCWEAARR
ncbi:MAG: cupin domain-containing protein [Acidimicrobiia bacterium]